MGLYVLTIHMCALRGVAVDSIFNGLAGEMCATGLFGYRTGLLTGARSHNNGLK